MIVFGDGVFFVFLFMLDCGVGLIVLGKDLIVECDVLGIIVDLLYLNEKGFDDVVVIIKCFLVVIYFNVYVVIFVV